FFFFFSSRRRHTRFSRDWSSDVCSSDLPCGGQCHCLRGTDGVAGAAAADQPLAGALPAPVAWEMSMQQRRTMRAGDQPLVKWTLIGLAIITTLLMLVIPLVLIFDMAFSAGVGNYWDNLSNQYTRHAIGLTLLVAALTVPINLVFGVFLAWLVTRFEFPGRKVLIT